MLGYAIPETLLNQGKFVYLNPEPLRMGIPERCRCPVKYCSTLRAKFFPQLSSLNLPSHNLGLHPLILPPGEKLSSITWVTPSRQRWVAMRSLPELLAWLNKQFNFFPLVYFSLPPLLQTAFAYSTILKLIIKELYAAEERHFGPPPGLVAFSSAAQKRKGMAHARPMTHTLLRHLYKLYTYNNFPFTSTIKYLDLQLSL